MQIFLDTANLDEIREAYSLGVVDGITTNPSLIKKEMKRLGRETDMQSYLNNILEIAKEKPVSLEVCATSSEEILKEAESIYMIFSPISKNICIKIPISTSEKEIFDGLKAIKEVSSRGITVNATLVFTPEQALLAAKAGATYVSPFAGRIDDHIRDMIPNTRYEKSDYFPYQGIKRMIDGNLQVIDDNGIVSGVDLVKKCVEIFKEYKIKTKIIAASIRNARQAREMALVGADIATIPYYVLKEMVQHIKTHEGVKIFTEDIVPEYRNLIRKFIEH